MALWRLSFSGGKTNPMSPQHRGHSNLATITKTEVPKVQNTKPEALPGQDRVPGEKNQNRECSAGPSAALGRATRSRPFRSEPPSPGGQATGRASTRARGLAAYPRRCPLAESGTRSTSDSAPSSTAQPAGAAKSRRRPPSLWPTRSVRRRRRQRRPRRPSPTGPAQPPLRREQRRQRRAQPPARDGGDEAARGGGAGLLPTPATRVHREPVTPGADPRQPAPTPVRTRRPRLGLRRLRAAGGREADTYSGVGCSGS